MITRESFFFFKWKQEGNVNNEINDRIIKIIHTVLHIIKCDLLHSFSGKIRYNVVFYGENISDTMSILWRNSGGREKSQRFF